MLLRHLRSSHSSLPLAIRLRSSTCASWLAADRFRMLKGASRRKKADELPKQNDEDMSKSSSKTAKLDPPAEIRCKTSANMLHHSNESDEDDFDHEALIDRANQRKSSYQEAEKATIAIVRSHQKKWLVYHRTSNYQNRRLDLRTRIVPRGAVLSTSCKVYFECGRLQGRARSVSL